MFKDEIETFLEAAYSNNVEAMQDSLEKNKVSDINVSNSRKETALMIAAQNNNVEVIQFLLKWESDKAASGSDVNNTLKRAASSGYQAVHFACYHGNLEALEALILQDKSIIHDSCLHQWKPLHIAASEGNLDIVTFLIDAKANINDVTSQGNSALILSLEAQYNKADKSEFIKKNQRDVSMTILKQADVDVTIANFNGVTALHRGALLNDQKLVRDIIAAGAEVDIEANNGMTAKQLTTDEGIKNMIDFMTLPSSAVSQATISNVKGSHITR